MGAITNTVLAIGSAALSSRDAKKSRSGANAAIASAEAAENAALSFAQEQYDDWKAVYGDLQTNLAKYYNSLTPEMIAAKGLQTFEEEKTAALTQVRETLAQRGISTSGIAGAVESEFALGSAQERAKIRANAPMDLAREKSSFLSIGLGQDPRSNVQSVLNNRSATTGDLTRSAISSSAGATQTARESLATAGKTIADTIGALKTPVARPEVEIVESEGTDVNRSRINSVGPLASGYK